MEKLYLVQEALQPMAEVIQNFVEMMEVTLNSSLPVEAMLIFLLLWKVKNLTLVVVL